MASASSLVIVILLGCVSMISILAVSSTAELIEDCCCDSESVDIGNDDELQKQLFQLRREKFFTIFKVNLYSDCPFWQENSHCSRKSCAVCGFCSADEIPSSWQQTETSSPVDRTLWPGFKGWKEDDSAFWVAPAEESQMSYINMDLNPEGYTGYEGEEPWRIWRAVYEENCFPGGMDAQCKEQRVFYRIFSGLHSAISCHIADNYPIDPSNIYDESPTQPNAQQFARRLGDHPDRINNLYFAYVFLLRALNKAAPLLSAYPYDTGNATADRRVRALVNNILSSRLVSSCLPQQSFDESLLFTQSATAPIKAQFKSHFRNISRIMDCVGCEKCRLHGKLQVLGIGTALKILFSDKAITENDLQRNEIIALFITVTKFSNAIRVVHYMKSLQVRRTLLPVGVTVAAILLVSAIIMYIRYRRRRQPYNRFVKTKKKAALRARHTKSDPRVIQRQQLVNHATDAGIEVPDKIMCDVEEYRELHDAEMVDADWHSSDDSKVVERDPNKRWDPNRKKPKTPGPVTPFHIDEHTGELIRAPMSPDLKSRVQKKTRNTDAAKLRLTHAYRHDDAPLLESTPQRLPGGPSPVDYLKGGARQRNMNPHLAPGYVPHSTSI